MHTPIIIKIQCLLKKFPVYCQVSCFSLLLYLVPPWPSSSSTGSSNIHVQVHANNVSPVAEFSAETISASGSKSDFLVYITDMELHNLKWGRESSMANIRYQMDHHSQSYCCPAARNYYHDCFHLDVFLDNHRTNTRMAGEMGRMHHSPRRGEAQSTPFSDSLPPYSLES